MSGVTTVKDLLLEHPPYALYASISNSSLSKKKWTDIFHSIPNPTIHPPTLDGVNGFLASDQYTPNTNTVYTADPSDINRLERAVYRLDYLDRVDVQTEGDVERDFHQNIALPVSLAWQNNGQFLQRSLSGPPGPTNTDKTVDHLYSWQVEGVAANERCQVIGEMKQHGVIRVDEWEGRKLKTPMTVRLGREVRGYAFEYKCPQVFVYDGKHLLIVQFKAKDRDDMKSAHCAIDCCVLARTPQDMQCGA